MLLDSHSACLAAGAAGLVLLVLLTVPALLATVSHFREAQSKASLIYEDKDGVASEESMAAYSAKVPKIIISILSVLGFSTGTAVAVLGTLHQHRDIALLPDWLNVAQWVCTHQQSKKTGRLKLSSS
jgi:hypothetical protein